MPKMHQNTFGRRTRCGSFSTPPGPPSRNQGIHTAKGGKGKGGEIKES